MKDFDELIEKINKFDQIIVYGTGRVAASFTETFKTTGLFSKIKYYAVSNTVSEEFYFYGAPVKQIDNLTKYKDNSLIIIATADKYYFEIKEKLKSLKFNFVVDFTFESKNWSILRENYFIDFFNKRHEKFKFYDSKNYHKKIESKIFMIKSHVDSVVKDSIDSKYANYLIPLQVGKALTDLSIASYTDNQGDNISNKNDVYCELTGHYWIWKNVKSDWVGVCHYRRHFELEKDDIDKIISSDCDVVLPIPIVNIPNVDAIYRADHEAADWEVMMSVLHEMSPDYYNTAKMIFHDVYYIAYNMMIAKKSVFDEYCAWLFPILFEIEKRASRTRNDKYQKRYIGFLAERLTSLFFIYNNEKLNILFTHKVFYR